MFHFWCFTVYSTNHGNHLVILFYFFSILNFVYFIRKITTLLIIFLHIFIQRNRKIKIKIERATRAERTVGAISNVVM